MDISRARESKRFIFGMDQLVTNDRLCSGWGIILLFSRFRFCVVAFKFLRRVGWISIREIGRAHGSGGYCARLIGDLSDWTLPSP